MVYIRRWHGNNEHAFFPVYRNRPESRRRRRDDDDHVTARCPKCRYWLIARQNKNQPYFFCLCPAKTASA